MYEEVGNAEQSSFYSDVAPAGGLGPAIQSQLKAIGSPLCMEKLDPDFAGLFPFAWERVEQKQRSSQITIAKHKRLFMLDFWDRGVCLAQGSTLLLPKVAEVIHAWIAEEVSTGELRRRFPFVGVESKAEFHEQGTAAEVERQWQALLSRVRSDQYESELIVLVEKAMEVPVLRRLFHYTSLSSLCFSRCTGYPFSGDYPSACPSSRAIMQGYLTPEQRVALAPEKPYTVADSKGRFLGQGDAEEAIALIVRHLPPDSGPAVQGTADDLG
jgi:hypothetical protein